MIELNTRINAPREVVFDLARSVDVHLLSTQQTNEKAIAGRTSGLLELGEEVTWQAIHFGISQKLTAKVTEFHRPAYFVDEMVKGAFHSFRHEHRFEEIEADQTMIYDIFQYKSPLGILGHLADHLFLKSYMTSFLIQRNEMIKSIAEKGN